MDFETKMRLTLLIILFLSILISVILTIIFPEKKEEIKILSKKQINKEFDEIDHLLKSLKDN